MMMTEYKIGLLSFFNHLPVLLLEGGLVYAATFTGSYQWIWLMLTFVILGLTLITIGINSNRVYGIDKQVFRIRLGSKVVKEFLLSDIKTIKQRKWTIEIGFKDSGKVKTIYLGWYIRKYKKLIDQLFENLSKLDNYDRIIFID